jgi:hypothetical protein
MKKPALIISVLLLAAPIYAQWSPPTRIHVGGGHYPTLLVLGDTVHVAYTKGPGRAKITYIRSADAGDSWSGGIVLNDTIDYTSAYYPRFIIAGAKIMILWYEASSVGQLGNIAYSISNNGGANWDPPQHALNPGLIDLYVFSAANLDSTINVIYSKTVWPQMGFYLVRSTNFGQSWVSPIELFRAKDTSLSDMEARSDTFHFVWSGNFEHGVNWEVYYIKSENGGLNWTEPETLTTPGGRGARSPALSINDAGYLALCWTDFRNAPPGWIADIFSAISINQWESWQGENQVTFLHLDGNADNFYHGDTIHVAFEREDVPIRKICYIKSTDNGITWEQVIELDLDSADSREPKVAHSNAKTYVVWTDNRDNPDTSISGGLYFSKSPHEPSDVADEDATVAGNFGLECYPNPFNEAVSIRYSLGDEKGGELEIYNIRGQKVRSIHLGGKEGKTIWDARDALGNKVSSGIYFARAKGGDDYTTIKLFYLK